MPMGTGNFGTPYLTKESTLDSLHKKEVQELELVCELLFYGAMTWVICEKIETSN